MARSFLVPTLPAWERSSGRSASRLKSIREVVADLFLTRWRRRPVARRSPPDCLHSQDVWVLASGTRTTPAATGLRSMDAQTARRSNGYPSQKTRRRPRRRFVQVLAAAVRSQPGDPPALSRSSPRRHPARQTVIPGGQGPVDETRASHGHGESPSSQILARASGYDRLELKGDTVL